MKIQELIKRFHYVGHKYWDWSYRYFKEDLQQEAYLCALLYKDVDYKDYLKLCNRHIRKLLKGFGYIEFYGKFDKFIEINLCYSNIDFIQLTELKRIEHLYNNLNYDYHRICKIYDIWDIRTRKEIKSLLISCFRVSKKELYYEKKR